MLRTLYTQSGKTITLGKKLGIGGEGAVYAVRELPDKVAKIYHVSHLPDIDKQNKLRFMADNAHSDLLGYIAWVEQTLHKRRGGRVIGFLMQKIDGCAPVHTLYNPSHRRQLYPKANWQFLLYTARNTAVALATLHKHGHVIGDINQGNLLFAKNSKVTLIDADSFQIQTPDKTHLCHVGVAHFTPPELQGNTQFDRVARTPNHDVFGLALLIFHLLFGGRHPFSGVPLIDDAGNLLEHDIKNYRYAYAPDNRQRGVKPPPTAIPIGLVPKNIQQLFIRAFTEVGKNRRPSADEWVQALDVLCQTLLRCRRQTLHIYPKHLSSCPWCALEKRGLFYFSPTSPTASLAQWDVYQKIFVYQKQLKALPDYQPPITTTQFQISNFSATYQRPKLNLLPYIYKAPIYKAPLRLIKALLRLVKHYTTDIYIFTVIVLCFAIALFIIVVSDKFFSSFLPDLISSLFSMISASLSGVSLVVFFVYKVGVPSPPEESKRSVTLRLAEQKYKDLEAALIRYEKWQQQYHQEKATAQTLIATAQKLKDEATRNKQPPSSVKKSLEELSADLDQTFSRIQQNERRLQRYQLRTLADYRRVAQEYAQARANLNL